MFDVQSVDRVPAEVSAPPDFSCSWAPAGRRCSWVHLLGNLTARRVPLFTYTLGEAQQRSLIVIVDLRGLSYIGGEAVAAIDLAHEASTSRVGHALILVRGSGQVDRETVATGLLARVEAIDLLRGGSPPSPLYGVSR